MKLIIQLDLGTIDHSYFDGQEVPVKNTSNENIGVGKVKGDIMEIDMWKPEDILAISNKIRNEHLFNLGIGGVITSRKENIITGSNLTEVSII